MSKIENFVKNRKFCQKSKILSKIETFVKNRTFWTKNIFSIPKFQLHELHRKAKHHKNKTGKNHKNSSDDSSKDYEVSDFEPVPDREDDQTPIEEDFDPELRSDYIYNAHNHPELDEPDNSKSDEYSHQEKTEGMENKNCELFFYQKFGHDFEQNLGNWKFRPSIEY